MEALIGAVYVVSSFRSAEPFFKSILQPFYDKYIIPPSRGLGTSELAQPPTQTLFELVQSRGCSQVRTMREDRDDGNGYECKSAFYR